MKNAFVRLKLQENGYSIHSKPLTIQIFPYRFQPKQSTQSRSAVILRISIAKHHVAAGTNSPSPPIMKNVRPKPNNPTETRTIIARTQIAAQHSELAMSDLHRIPESYIPVSPRQPTFPRRSGHPRVDEVESRGWGRRAPQSPSSSSFGAPQGNNKIYTYDVVFPPGEARIKSKE